MSTQYAYNISMSTPMHYIRMLIHLQLETGRLKWEEKGRESDG